MIQTDVEDRFEEDDNGFIRPDYDRFCFCNIPNTALSLFGIDSERPKLPDKVFNEVDDKEPETVVFLFIDGFGYIKFKEYSDRLPFFDSLADNGTVTPLTSVFPSSTAPSVTAASTGMTPQEHGLPEWTAYYPDYGQVIKPLPFTDVLGFDLEEQGYSPDSLFTAQTIYQELAANDVHPALIMPEGTTESGYSRKLHEGGEKRVYTNLADFAVTLREALEEDGKNYIYAYIDQLDTVSHLYGPGTQRYKATLSIIAHLLQQEIVEQLDKDAAEDTLLLFSADHGHAPVGKGDHIQLDLDGLVDLLQTDPRGEPIPPTGGPRAVFLHAKEGKKDELNKKLGQQLGEKAVVLETEKAVEDGLFGRGEPGEKFLERVGDLLILPRDDRMVWHDPGKFEMQGHHGGLTVEEAVVPFAAARLDDLL